MLDKIKQIFFWIHIYTIIVKLYIEDFRNNNSKKSRAIIYKKDRGAQDSTDRVMGALCYTLLKLEQQTGSK